MTKHLTLFAAAFLLFILPARVNAQSIGYSNFGRDYSNQVFRANMMNNLMRMNHINYANRISTDSKITFDFMFKNSRRRLSTASKIFMDSVKRKTYIEYTDITLRDNDPRRIVKIYPGDLQSVTVRGDIDHVFQPQLTTDSCWMFKAVRGEITLYSNGLAPVAMQKHDGGIQQFNKDSLTAIIKDDKQAMDLYNSGEYMKAVEKYNHNYKKAEDRAYDEAHRVD